MKTILIKANKGGVGKSWITLQLAHKLALSGSKILILTSDSQNNILNFSNVYDYEKQAELEYWLKNGTGDLVELRKNLYYIPFASAMLPVEMESRFENFIETLKTEFDYILVDSTPVLELDKIFINIADQIIIPTFLDEVTIGSITSLLNESSLVLKVKAIIPNRAGRTKLEKEYYENLKELIPESILLSVPINQSALISKAIDDGKTIWEYNSKKFDDFKMIFNKMLEAIYEEK